AVRRVAESFDFFCRLPPAPPPCLGGPTAPPPLAESSSLPSPSTGLRWTSPPPLLPLQPPPAAARRAHLSGLSGGGDSGCCSCRSSGSSLLRRPSLDRISTSSADATPVRVSKRQQPQQQRGSPAGGSDSVDRCGCHSRSPSPATPAPSGAADSPACNDKASKTAGVAPFSHPAIDRLALAAACRCLGPPPSPPSSTPARLVAARLESTASVNAPSVSSRQQRQPQQQPFRLHGIRRRRSCRRPADANATCPSCSNRQQCSGSVARSLRLNGGPGGSTAGALCDRSSDDLDDWQRGRIERQRVELKGGSGAALLGAAPTAGRAEGAEGGEGRPAAGKLVAEEKVGPAPVAGCGDSRRLWKSATPAAEDAEALAALQLEASVLKPKWRPARSCCGEAKGGRTADWLASEEAAGGRMSEGARADSPSAEGALRENGHIRRCPPAPDFAGWALLMGSWPTPGSLEAQLQYSQPDTYSLSSDISRTTRPEQSLSTAAGNFWKRCGVPNGHAARHHATANRRRNCVGGARPGRGVGEDCRQSWPQVSAPMGRAVQQPGRFLTWRGGLLRESGQRIAVPATTRAVKRPASPLVSDGCHTPLLSLYRFGKIARLARIHRRRLRTTSDHSDP
uniref:Protein kinase domain-containing protein n=1 Tax=Macrostomum lignano TaxID=282301 RepID=A0A1I8FNL5_9PLAT